MEPGDIPMPMPRVTPLILAAVCLSLACGSVPSTRYYTLGRIAPADRSGENCGLSVGVRDFEAEGLYARDNLLFREGGYEIQPDYYRRWSSPPRKLLADLTEDYVRSLDLFREVFRLPYTGRVDRVIEGRILRFEEQGATAQSGPRVLVELEFSLHDPADRQRLWRTEVSASAPLAPQHSADQVAAAAEKALGECLSQAARSLSGYLSSTGAGAK